MRALLLLLALLGQDPDQSDRGPGWLLIRGEPDKVGFLTYERIAEVYLGDAPVRIVRPDEVRESGEVEPDPATSRLVIGTPANNTLAARLTAALGMTVSDEHIAYAGRKCERGMGLVVLTEDPDGQGQLLLMTGVDEEGVFACFQAPLSLGETGWVIIRERQVYASGSIPLSFDTSRPRVIRLDREAEYLVEASLRVRGDERFLRIARGFGGYEDVFARAGMPDLVAYGRWLVRSQATLARAKEFFDDRDLEGEILEAHRRCTELLGTTTGPRPAYFVMYGRPDGTNARAFEADPVTGRRRVLFNLCALARRRHFDAAILHETVHTRQGASGPTLLERALFEGVPTYLSQVIDPTLSDADALLWAPESLRAAREHHDAILTAFRAKAASTDRAEHTEFMLLDVPLSSVPGAPSRTAYYVAWLAARAWRTANPERSPADLLTVPAEEIFAALD